MNIRAEDGEDISHQIWGKYTNCTLWKDGLFYSDMDFNDGMGNGGLKRGALPSPYGQRTEELNRLAQQMHENARLHKERPGFWSRLFSWL